MNETEERIIQVAKELFIKNGYEKTSMSQIAEKLEMNRPTLYYYFRTKEKMFQAVAGSLFQLVIPNAKSIVISDLPFFEKIEKVITCYMDALKKNPDFIYFIFTECRRDLNKVKEIISTQDIVPYLFDFSRIARAEMDSGRIKNVPIELLGLQLISQIIFPFLMRPIVVEVMFEKEEYFNDFLDMWKGHIMNEIKSMLQL
jgi:TetR/AcrR family transcriptional regulator